MLPFKFMYKSRTTKQRNCIARVIYTASRRSIIVFNSLLLSDKLLRTKAFLSPETHNGVTVSSLWFPEQ